MTELWRWRREQYDRLIQQGVLHENEPVELVGGQLMVSEPQGSQHAVAVSLAARALGQAFGSGWYVMTQLPVALDEESEPEPDATVVAGDPRDYRQQHPSRPALVVEVSESSLLFDRQHKGSLYARAGVSDYWIVNLIDRVLEVHRVPIPAPGAPFGWAFREMQQLGSGRSSSPLAVPSDRVAVADLLP